MGAKLVVTNPGNTLTFVGILNPAMSILKSPAFSVTLYLKPIVLIGNMWNGTIQQKYYLSTGKLENDIKKININLWWINEKLGIWETGKWYQKMNINLWWINEKLVYLSWIRIVAISLTYAPHFNPRLVNFLPHFSILFIIKSS